MQLPGGISCTSVSNGFANGTGSDLHSQHASEKQPLVGGKDSRRLARPQEDLAASLRARVAALLAEDVEESPDGGTAPRLQQSGPEAYLAPFSFALPRRVLLPGKVLS